MLRDMNVDANGVQHDYSVPPPLIRRDLIEDMYADARNNLPPVLLDCVMKMKQPFITPIYDFTAPRIVFGRAAMVGDAAANQQNGSLGVFDRLNEMIKRARAKTAGRRRWSRSPARWRNCAGAVYCPPAGAGSSSTSTGYGR